MIGGSVVACYLHYECDVVINTTQTSNTLDVRKPRE